MSIPTLVPEADRAPSLASRIVTIHATDVTEGAPAPDHFMFSLPCALRVPADDVILRPGGVKVRLVDGRAQVRLPVYSSAVQTVNGATDWAIIVKPSWGNPYAIRVPAGTSAISLADLPSVRPLTRREQQYAITGVGVTVTEGTQAGGSASYANGQLDFKLQVPSFRPQTVYPYIDQAADARAEHYSQEIRADLQTALDGKVDGTDPRLSDARTPIAHQHAVADVAGLAARLAALEQDTGARSLNALITGRISGDIILQRVGKTVFLTINELMVTPNNGAATWSLGSLLPVGFRFFPPAYRYFAGFARTANHNRGEIRVNRYGGLDIYNVNGLATNVSASWPTADAFPTTLPGTPA